MTALHMLAIDPAGLGGMVLRARAGPVRSRFETLLGTVPLPPSRVHPGSDDLQLFGGLDLSATLNAGRSVYFSGLTKEPHAISLTMAERCPARLAAKLSQLVDSETGHCLLLLDEGAEDDEFAPRALAERVAFHVGLDDVAWMETSTQLMGTDGARALYQAMPVTEDVIARLTAVAYKLGIASLRAPQFAIRAAKAHAALHGHSEIGENDIAAAAALVYASRAVSLPSEEDTPAPPEPDEAQPDTPPDEASAPQEQTIPDEMLIDAIRAVLPEGLLNMASSDAPSRSPSASTGAGARKKGGQRGRPLPSRPGTLHAGNRLDLLGTLRAAAPWQTVRSGPSSNADSAPQIKLRPGDFRIRRYEDRNDRLLIFAVDASGSAAMTRLAEAKGAVELMLADAYSSRDHVALIAFRGTSADMILPATRSLVQAKRRLTALPGGGGTPLALGLQEAFQQCEFALGKGMTPTVIVLTDGRGNINLEGVAGRASAREDAHSIAQLFRARGHKSIVLDVAPRPRGDSADLAQATGGLYLPLPRADAARIQGAVAHALDG